MTSKKNLLFLAFVFFSFFISAQEDCATAIPIPIGTSIAGDNSGAMPDIDYSIQTGCGATLYNSAHWYTFTTPSLVSSVNMTFTAGSIANATITIIDDCSSSSSFSFLWSECNTTSNSGVSQTICDLNPSTIYYIQISSTAADEGSFTLDLQVDPLAPMNDVCETAIELFGGVMECGEFEFPPGAGSNACPDYNSTGACFPPGTPGVWYTFSVPIDMMYSGFSINPVPAEFELYSSNTGCNNLVYEACGGGYLFFAPNPGTTYYFLAISMLNIQPSLSVFQTTCFGAVPDMDTGNGTGESDLGLNSCVPGDPIMPCQNSNIVWYDYTVGCQNADILIEVDQWLIAGPDGAADEIGIMAISSDCMTIMSQYDAVNGTGYVCSAIVADDDLVLSNIPAGTSFVIAVGSDPTLSGYYEIIVNEAAASGTGSNNDLCADAFPLTTGLNINLDNNCSTSDEPYINCTTQSQATVWYEYDPTPNIEDITINLSPLGIVNPAIAVYENCGGAQIDEVCGTSLVLECISGPILIQIGSASTNTGAFQLTLSTAPTSPPPPPIITQSTFTCSNQIHGTLIEIPGGLTGNIHVSINSSSSPDITGMMNHTFTNVNSANINDVLNNCGTANADAVYTVTIEVPGFSCPSTPVDFIITVYPKFITTPANLDGCIPYNITLDASDYISGGAGAPYVDYNWWWNGLTLIGSQNQLTNYTIAENGFILLEVLDANNCVSGVILDVTAYSQLLTTLTIDNNIACPGNPSTLNLNVNAVGGGPITLNDWTVVDEMGNSFGGTPIGNMYVLDTNNLPSGNYTASVVSQNANGCMGTSNSVTFTILPIPGGEIIANLGNLCEIELEIIFYDSGGFDIYNNGPDSNGDGIPDAFDLDNNGIADFNDVIWTTPTMGTFATGQLTFDPMEDGTYTAEIITNQNCSVIFDISIALPQQNDPSIDGPTEICEGQLLSLEVSPASFVSYTWFDQSGTVIGMDQSLSLIPTNNPSIFFLETMDANGCIYAEMTTVAVNPQPAIQITGSTSLCPGEITLISVGNSDPDWTYEWYDGMMTQLGSDSSSLEISSAGNYSIIVSNPFTCADTLDFVIDQNAELNIEIVGDNICGNQSTPLDGGQGFDFYEWTNSIGDVLGNNQTLTVDEPGCYIIYVELGMCNGTDTIEITQSLPPFLDIETIADICNTANAQTTLNFNDLANTSDTGDWISLDLPQNVLDDLDFVDFENVLDGTYQFVYTSNGAILPCTNVSDTLIVNVTDCACPNPQVDAMHLLCNTDNTFNLDDQLLPTTDAGNWSFESGPQNLTITNSQINILNIATGDYLFSYTLDPLPMMGCPESAQFTLEIVAPPAIVLDNPPSICNTVSMVASSSLDLSSLVLQGVGNWIDPSITNLDFSDPSDLNFVGVAPGNYTFEFISNNAMSPCNNVTTSIDISVIDCNCPFVDLQFIDDLCNDNGLIDLTTYQGISDPGTWSEEANNPSIVGIQNGQIDLTGGTAGLYTFIYTLDVSIPGCTESDLVTVQLNEPPEITSSENASVCNTDINGGSTSIDLTALVSGANGEWTDQNGIDITDPTSIDFSGQPVGQIYTFNYTTTTALAPCNNISTTIEITVIDCACDDPTFLDPPILCNAPGQSLDLSELVLSDHQGSWVIIEQPDGANNTLDQNIFVVEYVVPGDYTLEFSLLQNPGPNCPSSFTFDVTIVNQLVANVITQDDVCTTNNNGDITTYDLANAITSGSSQGYWIDEDGNVVVGMLDFLNTDPAEYLFTYILENEAPCVQEQYNLMLLANACSREVIETNIYIPNIFSPNGDNLNDIFFIQSNITDLVINDLYIFDRWGERVFRASDFPINDPAYGWNGQFKGQLVVPSVYQYLIDAVDPEGQQIKIAGDVTVLK